VSGKKIRMTLLKDLIFPEGFTYRDELVSPDRERALVERFAQLRFTEFEFRGFLGKRRTISFGWRYDFNVRQLQRAEEIPDFLLDLRASAAEFANLDRNQLQQVLVTEYASGAGIGWHRDRPEFKEVVGVSLCSACLFRLRRKKERGWERASIELQPRSAYLLRGPARTDWQHSIPSVDDLRYSVTFRSFRDSPNS
jgi:alkylated DNA repair dioxygenase AlkB